LRAFRSLVLIVERDPESGEHEPQLARLCEWIGRWDDWYRHASGLEFGLNFNLQYRRDAVLFSEVDYIGLAALRPVGDVCRNAGLAFGATVPMSEALEHAPELCAIAEDGWLQTLNISQDCSPSPEDACTLLEPLFRTKMQVRLSGNPTELLRTGLLHLPTLNCRSITIETAAPHSPSQLPYRPEPCMALFRIFVDSTGYLYPCLGMLGVEAARLGHIEDALEQTRIAGEPGALDLEALTTTGPSPDQLRPPERDVGISEICESHRAFVVVTTSAEST
jgi:hypothetical protein